MVYTVKCFICGLLSSHIDTCLEKNRTFPCPRCMKLDGGTVYPLGYWVVIHTNESEDSDEFFLCCRRTRQ